MTASFTFRGVAYEVSGWMTGSESDGKIISRADGLPIKGAKMHPGMIQTGCSASLERAADRAMRAAHRAEADAQLTGFADPMHY